MRRGSWAPLVGLALALGSLPARAQPRLGPAAAETSGQTEDQRRAQDHFQKARELYLAGNYREAITELEVARKLDPKAKDLVMNLGIVHEKLGRYDEAVGFVRSYLEMEGVTPAERTKAETMIKRLEGAKREAPKVTPAPTAPKTAPTPTPTEPPPRGRLDAATITVGAIAAIGLVGGGALGVYALTSQPGDGYVTGRDGSYSTLVQKTDDAHTFAILADVGLGVGVVAAVIAGWLYLGRTDPPTGSKQTGARVSTGLSPRWQKFAPLGLGGTF